MKNDDGVASRDLSDVDNSTRFIHHCVNFSNMVKINKEMEKILDVSEEKDENLIKCFKEYSKDNDAFLAIIAPYVGVKVTPSRIKMASMGISEEFGVETVIETIKEKSPSCNTLYLLINSPGGLVTSSYKIARALRKNFTDIVVFVPHIAASGGTLVALVGNKIVMGMMSQLSPLDPHSDDGISTLSTKRGFTFVTDNFRRLSEKDAPYPYKVLADKYDAQQLDASLSTLELMKTYIEEILAEVGYDEESRENIANDLVEGFFTHSDVITLDKASEIGLKACPYTEYEQLWETLRQWLGNYLLKSADKHIIRYWVNTTTS